MIDTNYADGLALLANRTVLVKSLLPSLEQTEEGIGSYI